MPRTRTTPRTTVVRLVFLALVGWALVAFRRRAQETVVETDVAPLELDASATSGPPGARTSLVRARRKTNRRRLATSLVFATLFFAGAALSAGAGDSIVQAIEGDTTTTTDTTTTGPDDPAGEAAPADADIPPEEEIPPADDPATDEPPPGEEAPVEGETPEEPPTDDAPGTDEPTGEDPAATPSVPGETPAPATPAPTGESAAPGDNGHDHGDRDHGNPQTGGAPLVLPHAHDHDEDTRAIDPEAEGLDGFATVWLHRTLPDPTPPAKRLAPGFAEMLTMEAKRAKIRWSTLLAAIRADGANSRVPATRMELRSTARKLAARKAAGEWQAFLALRGRTAYADRAQAIARYNRAVGLKALVIGLDAAKPRLEEWVLGDDRLDIYSGGRSDILAGGIDVRVLVLLRYMAEAHGQVTVSSLHSGHGLYARPGVVSAHIYGLAVDIAALDNKAIIGSNQQGGLTEEAVRNILLLPAELRPQQVISLFGMGGPSFAMANHADHIHVGY